MRWSVAAAMLIVAAVATMQQDSPQDYPQWRGRLRDGAPSAYKKPDKEKQSIFKKDYIINEDCMNIIDESHLNSGYSDIEPELASNSKIMDYSDIEPELSSNSEINDSTDSDESSNDISGMKI